MQKSNDFLAVSSFPLWRSNFNQACVTSHAFIPTTPMSSLHEFPPPCHSTRGGERSLGVAANTNPASASVRRGSGVIRATNLVYRDLVRWFGVCWRPTINDILNMFLILYFVPLPLVGISHWALVPYCFWTKPKQTTSLGADITYGWYPWRSALEQRRNQRAARSCLLPPSCLSRSLAVSR